MQEFFNIDSLLFYQELERDALDVAGDENVEVKFVHHAGHLWKLVGINKDGKVKLETPYNALTINNKDNSKEVNINEIKYI